MAARAPLPGFTYAEAHKPTAPIRGGSDGPARIFLHTGGKETGTKTTERERLKMPASCASQDQAAREIPLYHILWQARVEEGYEQRC